MKTNPNTFSTFLEVIVKMSEENAEYDYDRELFG